MTTVQRHVGTFARCNMLGRHVGMFSREECGRLKSISLSVGIVGYLGKQLQFLFFENGNTDFCDDERCAEEDFLYPLPALKASFNSFLLSAYVLRMSVLASFVTVDPMCSVYLPVEAGYSCGYRA